MQLVSTVTVGSGGASSIEFTSIPQTGTDLLLVVSARTTTNQRSAWFRINSSADLNYNFRNLRGDGGSGTSASGTSQAQGYIVATNPADTTANTFSSSQVYFPNYSGSTTKSYSIEAMTENNAVTAYQELVAGFWNQTTAITSLLIQPYSGTFAEHSNASLYIITKA